MTERDARGAAPEPCTLSTLDAARDAVRRLVRPGVATLTRLDRVRNLRLTNDVVTRQALPPFDNAAMDGFAVCTADIRGAPGSLDVAEAHPICTGMPVPTGTDAVIPIERTRRSGGRLLIDGAVHPGDHIRRAGEELAAGGIALKAGARLTPAAIGLLAAIGVSAAPVIPRPRVAVLVTGDEVVDAADELLPGQIHDADGPLLCALLEESGAEVVALEHACDDPSQIGRVLAQMAASADMVCTTGGASVGSRDHLIDQLGALGTIAVHQIAIRPGRPTSMGLIGTTPVFVLPGNPLALLAGFEALVRPGVRSLTGDPEILRPSRVCVAGEAIPRHDRLSLVLVRLRPGSPPIAVGVRLQGSAMLAGAALADGLALVEAGRGVVAPGESLKVERWIPSIE